MTRAKHDLDLWDDFSQEACPEGISQAITVSRDFAAYARMEVETGMEVRLKRLDEEDLFSTDGLISGHELQVGWA